MATEGVSFHDLSAGGQVGDLIRRKDWSATSLGALSSWPRSLKNHLSMIFELPTAAIIFWGPEQIQLYNDGYAVIMGPRHPKHLGSTFRECWPEAYDSIIPWMRRVLQDGETVEVNRTLVPLTRHGFTEESYFTFSFSPLRDDAGKIAGILQLVTEVTGELLAERRATALRELSAQTPDAKTSADALRLAAAVLGKYAADFPFCLFYVVDSADQTRVTLAAATGLPQGLQSIAEVARAARERTLIPVEGLPATAFAAPVFAADQQTVVAVFVAGISPRLRFDAAYHDFLELVCDQLATLMTAARAFSALAEVEHANTELEAFSYSVSHDLRAPLRAIDGFSKALVDDYSGTLDEQGRGYLQRVRAATQRMAQLIEDLLGLSRLTRAPLRKERVDVSALSRKILAELSEREPQRRVEAIVAEDLVTSADARLLTVVLENLLGNAWKFTAKQPAARIEVGRDGGGSGAFFVRDNGAGFDLTYAEKLFTPFQRFHAETEFQGTGIGLATVKRVIARHGGRIWAESSPGHGAAFFFTLDEHAPLSPA
jgi:signal transduction histidine kinase